MSYETAWREIINVIANVKGSEIEGDLDSLILCIEHLQSEIDEGAELSHSF